MRTDINLQIHDHAAGVFGKEISNFGAMLLGTVQELKAEVLSKNIIAAGTRPEEVAISFGGEKVANPRSTDDAQRPEGLGVAALRGEEGHHAGIRRSERIGGAIKACRILWEQNSKGSRASQVYSV